MIPEVTPTELARLLNSFPPPNLLDVREIGEHQLVALPKSKLIPLGQLAQRMGELESWKNQELVVYCHHGVRSRHALGQLERAGFTKIANLAGGMDRWTTEVDPSLPRY